MTQETVKTKGFFITDYGEPDVGLFEKIWTIKGDFEFENKKDFREFKAKLSKLWEDYASDVPAVVESFEEQEERVKKEEDQFNQFKN